MRLVILVCLAFSTFPAAARSWIVARNGSDRNSGTLQSPLATIARAAALAKPGDAVEVRAGTYREKVLIRARGSSGAAIVIRPRGKEHVVIEGSVELIDTAWVELTGFEIRGAAADCVKAFGASDTTISANRIHDCGRNGIWLGHESSGISTRNRIIGNTLFHNVRSFLGKKNPRSWPQALAIYKTTHATIARNNVYRNSGEGISVILSSDSVVRENTLADNFSVGIYIDNARRITVDRNFIRNSGERAYLRDGQPSYGIAMANERYDSKKLLEDLTITNNIIVGTRSAIFYGHFERGGGLRDVLIANNTCHDSTEALLRIDYDRHDGAKIMNNVFSQPKGRPLADVRGSGLLFATNLWSSSERGKAVGPGDIIGTPRFARAGGSRPEDYRLVDGSGLDVAPPAIGHDFSGRRRDGRADLGAFER